MSESNTQKRRGRPRKQSPVQDKAVLKPDNNNDIDATYILFTTSYEPIDSIILEEGLTQTNIKASKPKSPFSIRFIASQDEP
ncbi:hypothetical protein [Paenibacillus sp. FSL W7-1287]|uniref:hypothetical protein n=1 Tax=Paenibacillus sp. FSL W7-1287 TaxID=2954538 RepID=UPI0030F98192